MKLDRIGWPAAVVFLNVAISGEIGFAQEKSIDIDSSQSNSVEKKSEQPSSSSDEHSDPVETAKNSLGDSLEQAQRRTDNASIARIIDAMKVLQNAKNEIERSEQLWKNNEISNEQLELSRMNMQSADRNYQRLMDDYKTTMREILSQVTQAIADLEAAERWLGRVESMKSRVAVPMKTVDDARDRLDRAMLDVDRLKSRYELFAAEVLPHQEIQDAFARGAQFDNYDWGLRLAPDPVKQADGLTKTKYRGGMRILAVAPASAAAKNGIQKDDILVGLDKWETINPNNVTWIVGQLRERPENADAQQRVPFFIVRNGEVKRGFLPMPSETRQHTMED